MIALRKRHPALRRRTFFDGRRRARPPDIVWHGVEPCRPDFSPDSHALAFALDGRRVRPARRDRPRHLRGHERLVRAARVPDPGLPLGPALAAGRRHGPARPPRTSSRKTGAPRPGAASLPGSRTLDDHPRLRGGRSLSRDPKRLDRRSQAVTTGRDRPTRRTIRPPVPALGGRPTRSPGRPMEMSQLPDKDSNLEPSG